jgi:Arc/MetJ-type ribon-helix-helix transcriptional regulator
MTIQLSPKIESVVEELVSTGHFVDATDVVERAILLLEECERGDRLRLSLAGAIAAIRRGEGYEDTQEFWAELNAEADERERQGIRIKPDVLP